MVAEETLGIVVQEKLEKILVNAPKYRVLKVRNRIAVEAKEVADRFQTRMCRTDFTINAELRGFALALGCMFVDHLGL